MIKKSPRLRAFFLEHLPVIWLRQREHPVAERRKHIKPLALCVLVGAVGKAHGCDGRIYFLAFELMEDYLKIFHFFEEVVDILLKAGGLHFHRHGFRSVA